MVIQEVQKTWIEKDNIVIIGKLSVRANKPNLNNWGYNLLLRKESELDEYGNWWLVWFSDSPLSSNHTLAEHYPIDMPDFLKEYEYGRGNIMHVRSMGLKSVEEKDIDEILEKLFV